MSSWDNTNSSLFSRFPDICVIVDDWNNVLKNGMYMANGALNAPNPNLWFMGTVIVHASDWVVQKLIQFTGDQEFERSRQNGTWTPWVETSPRKLFQSVSNGKAVVNQAVTDMGIYTAPDAPFATTANNIRLLSTTKKGVGTYYFESYQTVFKITGLDFTPRVITFRTRATTDRFWGTYNADFTTSEFQVTANGASHGNVFSVFYGGFEVRVAHPTVNSGAMFDWFVSK